jgi:hypothetical protein
MEAEVDRDGRLTNYGDRKKRINYIIDKQIDYTMKNSIEKATAAIKSGLENYVNTTIKNQIGENVSKIIGLDNLIGASGLNKK